MIASSKNNSCWTAVMIEEKAFHLVVGHGWLLVPLEKSFIFFQTTRKIPLVNSYHLPVIISFFLHFSYVWQMRISFSFQPLSSIWYLIIFLKDTKAVESKFGLDLGCEGLWAKPTWSKRQAIKSRTTIVPGILATKGDITSGTLTGKTINISNNAASTFSLNFCFLRKFWTLFRHKLKTLVYKYILIVL